MFWTLILGLAPSQGAQNRAALKLWLSDMWSCVLTSCHIFDCVVRDVAILWYVVTCCIVFNLFYKASF